jgi:hypothetical protein
MKRVIVVRPREAFVPLGKNARSGYAIIDLQDVKNVQKHSWHLGADGYARALVDGRNVHLHRYLINNTDKDKQIDHINRNRLDNRRVNLRLVTPKQNAWNRSMNKNNTSGYTGVHFDNTKKKWVAQLSNVTNKVRKVIFLGYFNNINDAVTARQTAEKRIES